MWGVVPRPARVVQPARMATKTPPKTQVVRLRVTDAELEFLRRVAAEEDRSVSSVLRMALREFAGGRK